jgi:hypothetical protein
VRELKWSNSLRASKWLSGFSLETILRIQFQSICPKKGSQSWLWTKTPIFATGGESLSLFFCKPLYAWPSNLEQLAFSHLVTLTPPSIIV